MNLNHKLYDFCPHLLIPHRWGDFLKEQCESDGTEAEIPASFYLYLLGSISLDRQGKNRVLIEVNRLTDSQISQLSEVFSEELAEFSKNFQNNSERAYLTKMLCENLFHMTTILRLHAIIQTPRDENKILKKIVNHWLGNSEICLKYLQKYQNDEPVMKQILRYYNQK